MMVTRPVRRFTTLLAASSLVLTGAIKAYAQEPTAARPRQRRRSMWSSTGSRHRRGLHDDLRGA